SEISILESGIAPIKSTDSAVVFFVTVKNDEANEIDLSVRMVQCCETLHDGDSDCSSMNLIGGEMGTLSSGYTKNLTLIYPNLYVYNRKGTCSVSVCYRNQYKKNQLLTDINFDTGNDCPKNQNNCSCATPDLDYKNNCQPVDCLIKYSGIIGYFDTASNLCRKVPLCLSRSNGEVADVAYSPFTNECVDLDKGMCKKDLRGIGLGAVEGATMKLNTVCHHGTASDDDECVCDQGWITDTNDEEMFEPGISQHHLCNIQMSDWHKANKKRIRITSILIAIFALTIISKVLLLMCIMTWCYKHYNKRTEKTCSKHLDPDDPSIILCEDMLQPDMCSCCKDSKNDLASPAPSKTKPSNLQAQTVNVSYYSCCPSDPMCGKLSNDSSRISFCTNSSAKAEDSGSSMTISFPQDEESEDSDAEPDNSEDIAYGVYCSMDEVSGEAETEEVEEEDEEEDVAGVCDSSCTHKCS
ncbi:hypothetical protein GWI33_001767, partial [Rhynchophorus ferrugineus]